MVEYAEKPCKSLRIIKSLLCFDVFVSWLSSLAADGRRWRQRRDREHQSK